MALTLTDAGPGDILAATLAESATQALLDEVRLSPKPGLVDSRGSGSHRDLTLALMEHSAHSLTATFNALAQHCCDDRPILPCVRKWDDWAARVNGK